MATNQNFPPLKNDTILRAARREPTEYTPIWIMRQAGRYLPEFREFRVEKDFFTVCRTPELACELTLQPIRRYELDAAIIFSDILVVPQAMGLKVEMRQGKGPVFPDPLQHPKEIDSRLIDPNVDIELGYVFDAITLTRHKLEGKVPLIGFSGAPWTLMAYMIEGEGTKKFSKAKRWLYEWPEDSHKLMRKLTNVIIKYLLGQIKAGAQLLQLFDSWAGELAPDIFNNFCLPYLKQIAHEIKQQYKNVPIILFAKGANYALEELSTLEYDVLGTDWCIDAADAVKATGNYSRVALQGNMDPTVMYASKEVIDYQVTQMLTKFGGNGHIANLGHGLHPDMDPQHVGWFVDAVHTISRKIRKEKEDKMHSDSNGM